MTEDSLLDILEQRNENYDMENGREAESSGRLEDADFQVFENQKEHISKLRHLLEFDHKSETARKALDVGLLVLSTDFVDEEDAKDLFGDIEEMQ